VANLGDCKLMGLDNCGNIKDFTKCHNLTNGDELKDVISRGGIVLKKGTQYRINGELNLSRCFGDKNLKYCLSSKPDLLRFNRSDCRRWVLASDGFYLADNLEKRLKVTDFSQLSKMLTVYKDNASAIFLDL
jgi:serine/threonine protein phosphatase PrpC